MLPYCKLFAVKGSEAELWSMSVINLVIGILEPHIGKRCKTAFSKGALSSRSALRKGVKAFSKGDKH